MTHSLRTADLDKGREADKATALGKHWPAWMGQPEVGEWVGELQAGIKA